MQRRPGLLNMKLFCVRQFNQIKKEGFPVAWRKMKRFLQELVGLPLVIMAVPVVLIIRILKPVVRIRFGYIFARRIGHFVFDVEYYLCERKIENPSTRTIDFFFYRVGRPANSFFAKMCERQMRIRSWTKILFNANHWLPGGQDHELLPAMVRYGSRDVKGLFQQTETQLFFTEEENLQGQMFLKKIGFTRDDKLVCLIARDAAYLSKCYKMDTSYHNYRDTDIETYEDTTIALAEKGYWVFRMGKVVRRPLTCGHPRILDYANSAYRSDFLDIWLMANCFFCISNGIGLDEVSRAFRKPAVYVNYLPFQHFVTYDYCISVPKHMVWKDKERRLTLSEYLVHSYYRSEKYEKEGITIHDLSSQEILKAVLEMEERISGRWKDTREDNKLQDKFWELFRSHKDFYKYHGKIHPEARVGAHFLRSNPEWLN